MPCVTIALRHFHHAGAHRIEMNITDQFEKVFVFLTYDGLITPFKKVSGLMMFNIEILAVGLLQALHELRERLLRALDQQMDVIGHQAVGVQHIVIFLTISSQSFDIGQIVALRCECLLALVAAHNNVIQNPRGE